jgi:hypothetical protein
MGTNVLREKKLWHPVEPLWWGEMVGVGGSTISKKWGNHVPCQPTIAAQLLGNGGKIEPYTIIIMPRSHKKKTPKHFWQTKQVNQSM